MPRSTTYGPGGYNSALPANNVVSDVDQPEQPSDVIAGRVRLALSTNQAFMDVASPSNAQVLAQVRALTKEATGVIRMLIASDDLSGT